MVDPIYYVNSLVHKTYKVIDNEIGQGTYGKTFLVITDEKVKYIIKVAKHEKSKSFDKEIYALNKIKKKKDKDKKSYVINIIEHFDATLTAEDQKSGFIYQKELKHIVLDYLPNKTLDYYFYKLDKSISDKYAKAILLKIAMGLKEIHDANLCHLDLKLQNIILDDKYNPIICDFGFCSKYSTDKKISCGTPGYLAPEIFFRIANNGFKCDIFSLGIIFFIILTGKDVSYYLKKYYKNIKKNNKDYEDKRKELIIEKNHNRFLDEIGVENKIKIPELFFEMVRNDPLKRPTINQIIEDSWFDEIKNLNEEGKKKLDKEIEMEFKERSNLKKQGQENKENNVDIDENNNFNNDNNDKGLNKSIGNNDNQPFKQSFELDDLEEKNLDMNFYFKINDFTNSLNVRNFMNNLVNQLNINLLEKENESQKLIIKPNEEEYQINITFKNKEQEITEEIKELGFNSYKEYLEAFHMEDLVVGVKLYKNFYGYLVKVYKKEGSTISFNEYLEKIMKIIKDMFN